MITKDVIVFYLKMFTEKIKTFGYFYMETRLKDEKNQKLASDQLTKEQKENIKKQMDKIKFFLDKASKDTAIYFIDALELNLTCPDELIINY